METTNNLGLQRKTVSSVSRFGPSNPKYGYFTVPMPCARKCTQNGPKGGERVVGGALWGCIAPKGHHARQVGHKASQTRNRSGPLWAVWSRFWGGTPFLWCRKRGDPPRRGSRPKTRVNWSNPRPNRSHRRSYYEQYASVKCRCYSLLPWSVGRRVY